jgi:hypothetical protein
MAMSKGSLSNLWIRSKSRSRIYEALVEVFGDNPYSPSTMKKWIREVVLDRKGLINQTDAGRP